jgi:hypothetical protein
MKIRSAIFALLSLAALLCSGCITSRSYRLPPIKADEISATHTDWFGTVRAHASGLHVTESYLMWERAEWLLTYGGWSDHVVATNYRQRREKEKEEAK